MSERSEEFAETSDRLEERLECVQEVLDERSEIQWAVRNDKPIRIYRMSLDPTARNFKINAVPLEVVAETHLGDQACLLSLEPILKRLPLANILKDVLRETCELRQ